MKPKKIKFATNYKNIEFPKPARNYVPKWYKEADRFVGGVPDLDPSEPFVGKKTFKLCAPFLDAMTNGYIVELWQDIQVKKTPHGTRIFFEVDMPTVIQRNGMASADIKQTSEYTIEEFVWKFPFYFQTPKGYSLMFTHPLNRNDLPFTTFSGIVDADTVMSEGNLPFSLKKDFEGIIPMGTPIVQLIPIKRDTWISKQCDQIIEIGKKNKFYSQRVTFGWYKQLIWKNKKFN